MRETNPLHGQGAEQELSASRDATVAGDDALAICAVWKQFRNVDFGLLYRPLRRPVIIEGQNLFIPE